MTETSSPRERFSPRTKKVYRIEQRQRSVFTLPRQLTQAFLEQLEREHGGSMVHVCCECDNDRALDSNALILLNEECPTHGRSWHRLMLKQPDGSLTLAMPLSKKIE